MMRFTRLGRGLGLARHFAAPALALGVTLLGAAPARAQTAACLSPDPTQWPSPSKPYFMIVVDTSGSMGTAVPTGTNSCGYQHNRIGDARCAVKKTVQAFGEVNFGLATYAWQLQCPAGTYNCANCDQNTGCFPNTNCVAALAPGDDGACGPLTTDPALNAALNNSYPGTKTMHAGGLVAVPLVQDNYWSPPPNATNVPAILNLVDNNCGNGELGAFTATPLGGVLFGMNQYFAGTFRDPFTGVVAPSPIGPATFGGQPAERACRSINVILITDGDETCDAYNAGAYPGYEGLAVFEAGRLVTPGVTVSGQTFGIKTYVIGFLGATTAYLDHIAAAGGTTASYSANNETQLSQALANIIGGAIKPESCDNADNNCNGCVDEGFKHYCDVQPTAGNCCAWATTAARTTCLTNYKASITTANPQGNLALLPCTTAAQAQATATWLCYDPQDVCDNVDNNCNGAVDENITKCGSPLHCPQTEVCNGQDDNCDGLVDEGGVCVSTCLVTPSAEVCDGCDNDCNGFADDGISASIPCGPTGPGEPANCTGTITCKPAQAVAKGGCVTNGGYTTCSNSPQTETCDALDNDCNGIVDDNVASVPCIPSGIPAGLVYGGTSACKKGQTVCTNGTTQCVGFVGPSTEVCNGVDDDCDGVIDDGAMPGIGQACGTSVPPCAKGTTACVGGALVCQGGVQPQAETCNGIDDNCDGTIDNQLTDAPVGAQKGCWTDAGNCCSFLGTVTWCPPAGATCTDAGSLTTPCQIGALACVQGAWKCQGPIDPTPEVCDGIDNDCNGQIDEGFVSAACGSNVGECQQGVTQCSGGKVSCVGGVGPTAELCDGKDNDCDGTTDNGIVLNNPCDPTYDTTQFPPPRIFTSGTCKQGLTACDGNGGVVCQGGVGPSAEICDGKDNDCDGQVDETGAAPDGIDGTSNPSSASEHVGDACGTSVGTCVQGHFACVNAAFACVGGQGPQPEICDCLDNDCDGTVDNDPSGGDAGATTPICGSSQPAKTCVSFQGSCQCAPPCKGAENPCPTGPYTCEHVGASADPAATGNYCVEPPSALCGGDCATQTVKVPGADGGAGAVECAPSGAIDAGAVVPVCVCKGQPGCHSPCYGVTCSSPLVCALSGPKAGTCVVDNCWNVPCPSGQVCNLGACQPSPCAGVTCPAGQFCKPSADFKSHTCDASCAGVACAKGQACVDGACVDTGCPAGCVSGQVCSGADAGGCVADKCVVPDGGSSACANGACCDPLTGVCGNCPCEGIACPSGQVCSLGQCLEAGDGGAAGGGGSGGSAGSAGSGGAAGETGGSATGGEASGRYGLTTGGGGCTCETGPGRDVPSRGALAWLALGLSLPIARRRRPRRAGAVGGGAR